MKDIYLVLIIALIIWIGLFVYLFFIDRQIRSLKRKVELQEHSRK